MHRPPLALLRVLASTALLLSAHGAGAGQTCEPVPPGALAWYPAERHADDRAGFHNGTLSGGAGYVDGHVGEAFRFDGVDDALSTDVTSAERRAVRDAFSFELWVRPTQPLGVCAQSNTGNCADSRLPWAIFPSHGHTGAPSGEADLAAGVGVAIGTTGICVGEHSAFLLDCLARFDTSITDWTHIVAVVENRTPRIYVNGVLVHTGVASAKQFVFASWELIGSGSTLGRYAGDLDEVTVYGRALSDLEIAGLASAGASGKCRPACARQRTEDAWQLAQVSSHSGTLSSIPDGMFGATNASPEADSTLFADGQPDGTVHAIEWQTDTPVTLAGFGLLAFHDGNANTQRAFRRVRLQARELGGGFATLYDAPIVLPYEPAGRELERCVNLRPRLWQEFRAEFTQDGPAGFSGPRVVELDAVGLADAIFRDGFESAP